MYRQWETAHPVIQNTMMSTSSGICNKGVPSTQFVKTYYKHIIFPPGTCVLMNILFSAFTDTGFSPVNQSLYGTTSSFLKPPESSTVIWSTMLLRLLQKLPQSLCESVSQRLCEQLLAGNFQGQIIKTLKNNTCIKYSCWWCIFKGERETTDNFSCKLVKSDWNGEHLMTPPISALVLKNSLMENKNFTPFHDSTKPQNSVACQKLLGEICWWQYFVIWPSQDIPGGREEREREIPFFIF